MTARLLAFRALLALLLATIGLQAVPAHAFGVERHHGSAFDISAYEVATAAALRSADHRLIKAADPDPAPPAPPSPTRIALQAGVAVHDARAVPLPRQAIPPLPQIASRPGAPRAPPLA